MKKIYIILCAVLLFMSFPVQAVGQERAQRGMEHYSIVIKNAVAEQTYSAYKIFDYAVDGDGKYIYAIRKDSVWYHVLQNMENGLIFREGNEEFDIVEADEDFSAEELAEFLKENIPEYAVYLYQKAENDEVTIDVAERGYYFVTTTLGSLCSLNTTTPVAEIQEKNIFPDIDKNVYDSEKNDYVKKTSASVGDTVVFKTELVNLHLYDGDVTFCDEMCDELELIAESISVMLGENAVNESNYTIEYGVLDEIDFQVTVHKEYISTLKNDDTVEIYYSARLKEEAFGESINTAYLTYGDNVSEKVSATVENFSIDVIKINETNTVIQGAEFLLYDALTGGNIIPVKKIGENEYRPAVEGEQGEKITAGKAVVKGLRKRKIYIEEVSAPANYNKLDERITVNVSKNMTAELETTLYGEQYKDGGIAVINRSGFTLPAMGGKGIIIISGAGLMIVGLSVILFAMICTTLWKQMIFH